MMKTAWRLLVLCSLLLALPVSAAFAADAPCLVISLGPGHTGTLSAAEVTTVTKAVRDGMQPGVPRAKVMLKQDMLAALTADAHAGASPDTDPLVQMFEHNSVPARWDVIQLDHFTSLDVIVQGGNGFELFNRVRQVPNGSPAKLVQAATELARQAGQQIAGQLYCLALSEHAVTIDYNQPAQRRHPFHAHLIDLTGAPVSGQTVTFAVESAGSTVTPARDETRAGTANTTFDLQQPQSNRLTASTHPPHQSVIEDSAVITVTGEFGLYIRGRHHLDMAKICADKLGPLGSIVQLAQLISPMAHVTQQGEEFKCAGQGTEDDDLLLPALHKTATGYTGTARWNATIDTPDLTMTTSQMTVNVKLVRPYSLTYQATVTATPINGNARHLEVKVEGWAKDVPSKGGGGTGVATFNPNGFWGAMQGLARTLAGSGMVPVKPGDAAKLQNPATVAIPPNQPESAYFELEFPITLPDPSEHRTQLVPFQLTGTDQLGSYRYTIGGAIGITTLTGQ